MKIKTVEVHNWRSIKDIKIEFQDIMIFIGQNNHGKSNILSALLFFFGEITHNELDFNDGSKELYVEITFANLDESDRTTFKKYVTADGTIKVRKEATKDEGIEYHGYLEVPEHDWLKEENIGNYRKKAAAEKLPLKDFLPDSGQITIDSFKNAQEAYIAANKDTLIFNYEREKTKFLGLTNVAKGIFGEVFHIPSVKSASDELNVKGKSSFAQLYSQVINKLSKTNVEYKEAKDKILSLIKNLNKTDADGNENIKRPTELTELETNLEKELIGWNTKIEVEITPPNIEDAFKIGTDVWIDDGVKTDISRKGHGLQRALIFALIKSYAMVLKEEKQKENIQAINAEGLPKISRAVSNSTYFIIEEPELYLHPQAQREFYSSLVELSNPQNQNQVILCTHSSSFIDLNLYKSICIIKKNNLSEGTVPFQYTGDLFAGGVDKKKFNMVYWINPDRGELFFAKKVILVEGPTDKTVIPNLAKKINVFRYDYTLIDCGGKDCIKLYVNLLNKFKIPYVAVYDKDHQQYKLNDAKNLADNSSREIENLIDSSLGYSVIFENDIEEELGILDENKKNKPYYVLKKIEDSSFNLSTTLEVKIRKMYGP